MDRLKNKNKLRLTVLTSHRRHIVITGRCGSDDLIYFSEYTPHNAVSSQSMVVVKEILSPSNRTIPQKSGKTQGIANSSIKSPIGGKSKVVYKTNHLLFLTKKKPLK